MALTVRTYDGAEFSGESHWVGTSQAPDGWWRVGHTGDRWTNVAPPVVGPGTMIMFDWPISENHVEMWEFPPHQIRDDGRLFIRAEIPRPPWWRRVLDRLRL